MNLAKMFATSCSRFAERPALIHEGRTFTYRQLGSAVDAFARYMQAEGFSRGDNIALILPNCPEFIIAYMAIQKLGAVAVTLNIQSTPYELRYLLSNSDARGLVTTAAIGKRYEEIKSELPLCHSLLVADGTDGRPPLRDWADAEAAPLPLPQTTGDDPATIIYTSGLTGHPLGAVLTQHNLVTQSELLRQLIAGTEQDRNLSIIPFFHSFGASVNMLATIRIGASMVLMERFKLEAIFSVIERERVTFIAAVPRLFLGMLLQEGAQKYDTSSLRVCITGGAAMPAEFIPVFEDRFKVRILEGYGLTEASPVCTFSRLDMPSKHGSIGVTIPGVEGRICDEEGRELPRGQVGELTVRGDNVMRGYYGNPAATTKVIRGGWLHTGDLGRMDEEGYIFLAGRKKRMIITSGFNVYPQEVEAIIAQYPGVAEAHVVAQPDLIRGEVVKAIVRCVPGADVQEKDLMKHCRTYLSSYKLPRQITIVDRIEH